MPQAVRLPDGYGRRDDRVGGGVDRHGWGNALQTHALRDAGWPLLMADISDTNWRKKLRLGVAIPAHPLALDAKRKLDERRQRALTRYYLAAGAGGIAVGVHTTEFGIHDPKVGLLKPVLELAAEESGRREVVKIGGVCGERKQAIAEAELAKSLGYDAVLLSLAALPET